MSETLAGQLLAYLQDQQQPMTDFLRDLVLAESPSLAPEAQERPFGLLAGKLRELGYRVRRGPGRRSGGFLLARPWQRQPGRPVQLLLGHCDTVWPAGTLREMPLLIEDNRMMGPGVYDMKAGLTQIVFALQALHDLGLQPRLTPVVFINSDEEIGSPDSKPWVARLARCAARAFVLEPSLGPEGKLKTARKGIMRFDVEISGKASHAGLAPEEGASAILELAHVIQALFALNDWERGVSVNVGVVQGGLRPNVIAASSRAEVDVRVPAQADAERVAAAILGLQPVTPGTSLHIIAERRTPPLERTPRNRQLWRLARELGREIGLELDEGLVGGGSDGNTSSQFTATLDGLGAVGAGAHARHEFVYLDRLAERTALLVLLLLAPSLAENCPGRQRRPGLRGVVADGMRN